MSCSRCHRLLDSCVCRAPQTPSQGLSTEAQQVRRAINLCNRALRWADGGGRITRDDLLLIREELIKASGSTT